MKGTMASLEAADEDEIMGLIADGQTIGSLGKRYGVSRRTFYNWINAGGKERRAKIEAAKKEAAESHVDKAEEILLAADPATIQVAKEQANHFRWKATKLDRDTWGEKPANLNVSLDIGSLHLDALRQAASLPRLNVPTIEAELVDDGA